MTFRKSFLSLSCLLLLSSFNFLVKSADTVQCDPKNRPVIDTCFQKPNIQTCGYYKENCPFKICGFPAYNGCAACSDPNVLYYKTGDCKPEEVVQRCSPHICRLDLFPEQLDVYEPVCGLRKGTTGDNSKTFDNMCQACQNGYPYFQAGICKDDKIFCSSKRPTSCNTQYSPVCAHLSTFDVNCAFTTVSNACEACSDPAVDFYIKGECHEQKNGQTYCLPHNRPEACTRDYNPVCGFYKTSKGKTAHKVFGNACSACAESDVIYHIPGPCEFQCDHNPNAVYDCVGDIAPVCGEYTENGKKHKISLRNSCVGCYYSGKPIESYTEGLCPGDKGIRCENDDIAFKEGILRPVCGYTEENCKKDSCRKTYAEPSLACSDKSVIGYEIGKCPEDEGVPCDQFRKRPKSGDSVIYENVYGFTQAGCTKESCKKNYDDHFEACKNPLVLFFKEGHC